MVRDLDNIYAIHITELVILTPSATKIELTHMCREARIGGNGTNDIRLSESFPDHQSGLYRSHFGVKAGSFQGHFGH